MRLYTFFPFSSGVALSFEAETMASDEDAIRRAEWLLERRTGLSGVAIWEGQRFVKQIGYVPRSHEEV